MLQKLRQAPAKALMEVCFARFAKLFSEPAAVILQCLSGSVEGKVQDAEATDRRKKGMEKASTVVEELLGAGFKGCATQAEVEQMHQHLECIDKFLPTLAEGVPSVCSALSSGTLPTSAAACHWLLPYAQTQ